MESKIDLGNSQAAATNKTRRMVGQAPYVVNAGVAYASQGGRTSATLLFNRTGDRIDAAGDLPLPDVIQLARNVMDVSLRFPVFGAISGRFDARNLLDPETVRRAGFAYEGIGRPSSPVEGRLAPQPPELAGALARSLAEVPAG